MKKNIITTFPFSRKQVHLSDPETIGTIIEPGIYAITTDNAINGETDFMLLVNPIDADGKMLSQIQMVPGRHNPVIASRSISFDREIIKDWTITSLVDRPFIAPVGYTFFNTNTGKPEWLKSNTREKAVFEFGFEQLPIYEGTLTLDMGDETLEIELVAEDLEVDWISLQQVFEYFLSQLTKWTLGFTEYGFILTHKELGLYPTPTITDDGTGAVITIDVVKPGSDYVWVDAMSLDGNPGDLFICNADGVLSKLVAPLVASTLKHSGEAGTLPFWEADPQS